MTDPRRDILTRLHDLGAVQFGAFTLKSGAVSPVYFDLRLLASDPELLEDAAELYADELASLEYDRLAGIPLAGLPIATAVALVTGRPMVYPRMSAKSHGTGRQVEGLFESGDTVAVLDDVISSGLSKLEAIAPLEESGMVVSDVVVLVDRQTGGAEELEAAGYRLRSVFTLDEIVDTLLDTGHLDDESAEAVRAFARQTREANLNQGDA